MEILLRYTNLPALVYLLQERKITLLSPQINRVERGTTTHLSPAADKLARAIVTAAKDGERARKLLVALAE